MFLNYLRVSCRLLPRSPFSRISSNLVLNAHKNYCQAHLRAAKVPHKDKKRDDNTFLLRKQDPDTFGDIGGPQVRENKQDEDDLAEERFNENPRTSENQLGIRQYADMMKDFIKQKKIFEAIKVLEERMLVEDRAIPTNYIYNILIGGCATLGYDKKAFQLYTNMKQRQLKVTGATYTNLFNACANSPYPKNALEKAQELREQILEKGYVLNVSNYNCMIKAFGRLRDIRTAFSLVDEMQTKKLPVRPETYNFLLQAAASDPNLGFRHALIIWHKMYRRRMEFDRYTFNMMLRCVRDCGLGDAETTERLIQEIITLSASNKGKKAQIKGETKEILTIGETKIEKETVIVPVTVETSAVSTTGFNMPNLLSDSPQMGDLLKIAEVTKPEERLLLLGGLSGFFAEMDKQKIKPDVKTFTQLLEIIPSTLEAEKKLLKVIRERGVVCDVDFFNMLIKKRALRNDFEQARRVLTFITTAGLKPDIVTYGVLALACGTEEEARNFLIEMEVKGIRPTVEILGAMLRKAGHVQNFSYACHVLKLIKKFNFKPNPVLLKNVYKLKYVAKHAKEEGHESVRGRKTRDEIKKFKFELNEWMENLGIRGMKFEEAVAKYKVRPYDQFKEPAEREGMEEQKTKFKSNRKKPMRRLETME